MVSISTVTPNSRIEVAMRGSLVSAYLNGKVYQDDAKILRFVAGSTQQVRLGTLERDFQTLNDSDRTPELYPKIIWRQKQWKSCLHHAVDANATLLPKEVMDKYAEKQPGSTINMFTGSTDMSVGLKAHVDFDGFTDRGETVPVHIVSGYNSGSFTAMLDKAITPIFLFDTITYSYSYRYRMISGRSGTSYYAYFSCKACRIEERGYLASVMTGCDQATVSRTTYSETSTSFNSLDDMFKWIDSRVSTLEGFSKTDRYFRDGSLAIAPDTCQPISREQAIELLKTIYGKATLLRTSLKQPFWGNLARDAYQDVGLLTNNGLSFIKEIPGQKATVTGFVDSLLDIAHSARKRDVTKMVKSAANAFLSNHYGIKLTIQDTMEYAENLARNVRSSYSRCSATESTDVALPDGSVAQRLSRYHVYYLDQQPLNNVVWKFLDEYDLNPTLENLWDSVPYSFVIDWFTKFGDYLQSVDNLYRLECKYKVLACIQSVKWNRTYTVDFAGNSVLCTEKLYSRSVTERPVSPSLFNDATIHPLNHWIEGGSLVAQRL